MVINQLYFASWQPTQKTHRMIMCICLTVHVQRPFFHLYINSVQGSSAYCWVYSTTKSVMHASVMANLPNHFAHGKKCMRLTSILLYLLNYTFVA